MPPLRDRLVQANLLIASDHASKIQRYPALLMGASLGLGLIRWIVVTVAVGVTAVAAVVGVAVVAVAAAVVVAKVDNRLKYQ